MSYLHEKIEEPNDYIEKTATILKHPGYDAERINVMELLHEKNPYEEFDYKNYQLDKQGWNGEQTIFGELIKKNRPRLIVEIGTWKGQSAITMAKELKKNNINGKIVCVDTWLGSVEFYTNLNDNERYQQLKLKNGYPIVYYQFLANVCHEKLEDYIVPFPVPSIIAARWFKLFNIEPDLIYIDGSHDEHDAYYDIKNYHEILKTGGTLFGDDIHWAGPRNALLKFCEEKQLNYSMGSPFTWIMEVKK